MIASQSHNPTMGLADAPLAIIAPRRLFARIAADSRYGWALGVLLLATTLIGWSTVQTGLIDREIDEQTFKALADLEREQADLVSRTELSERIERALKAAEFTKLLVRGGAVLAAPLGLVASLMLIAAVMFAVVALVGNKPDYPTLMALGVYAAVVDVLAAGLRLAMMLCLRTMDVDTSLSLLAPGAEDARVVRAALSGIDPFRIWFWVLLAMGLVVTGQLSRRAAAMTCGASCLIAILVRAALAVRGAAPG